MAKRKKLHPLAIIFIISLALVLVTFACLHIFVGMRYVNDKTHKLKFVGIVKNDIAVSGKLYYYDGTVATLNAEKKTIEVKGGDKYVGALSGYLPHGNGTLTKADGTVFEGDFYEGYCTGNATVTYKNGDVYIGQTDHEIREGKGIYISTDGTEYTGTFHNNEKNGFGVTKFSDGSVYIGEYKSSIKDGKGAYLFTDGDIYVGDFKADKRSGKGIYIWSKSEEYSSEFENLFDAENTSEFEASFIGYLNDGFERHFRDGELLEINSDNSFVLGFEKILTRNQIECYIGDFVENELTGEGKYRWLSGRVYKGIFDKGEIVPSEPAEE